MRKISHSRILRVVLLAAAFLCLIQGASVSALDTGRLAPEAVLATWKGGQITLEQLQKYMTTVKALEIKKVKPEEVPPILREMALNEYLFQKATSERFVPEKRFLELAEAQGVRALLPKVYVEEEITKKTVVTDKEVDAAVAKKKYAPIHVIRVFSAKDKTKIDAAMATLLKGEKKFEDLAREKSEGLSAGNGGMFGEIDHKRPGPFAPDQVARILALKEGMFTDPMELPVVGWTIAAKDKIITAETQRKRDIAKLTDAVKLEKEKKIYWNRVEALRKKSKIVWDPKVRRELLSLTRKGEARISNVSGALAKQALVTVNGRPVYVGEVVSTMAANHGEKELETFLKKRVNDELVIQEAYRLGLDRRIGKELDGIRKYWTARAYLQHKTKDAGAITEKDLRDHFAKNAEQFRAPERRALQVIQVRDAKLAETIRASLEKGADFEELAAKHNDTPDGRQSRGNAGYLSGKDVLPETRDKVFALKKGAISETFALKNKEGIPQYVIVKVVDIAPSAVPPFEKVSRELLKDRLVAARKEDALRKFLSGGPALQFSAENLKKIGIGG